MEARTNRRALLTALFLLALGGLLLHMRAHPLVVADKAHPGATVFRGAYVAAAVLPVRAQHETIAVVYGDDPGGSPLPELLPLIDFTEQAGRALDQALVERRAPTELTCAKIAAAMLSVLRGAAGACSRSCSSASTSC